MQKYFDKWANNHVRITILALLYTANTNVITFGNVIFTAI